MLDMFIEMDAEDIGFANDDDFDCDFGATDNQGVEVEISSNSVVLFDDDFTEISFKGSDEQYWQTKVEHAVDQRDWNLERAQIAMERGQKTVYEDHMGRAEIWSKRAEQFQRSVKIASKKN